MAQRALILANGRPPAEKQLRDLLKECDFFLCADGGANYAADLGIKPDMIIGDLDSIKAATVRKFARVKTRRIADQNSTDLEKALAWLVRSGCTTIVVAGATGGRLDHLAGNLSAFGKYARRAHITFVEEWGEAVYVGSELTLDLPPGTVVSLIPLSRCEGIVTQGLKWELRNGMLELGLWESTSNEVRLTPVVIKVRRGNLLLYRVYDAHAGR